MCERCTEHPHRRVWTCSWAGLIWICENNIRRRSRHRCSDCFFLPENWQTETHSKLRLRGQSQSVQSTVRWTTTDMPYLLQTGPSFSILPQALQLQGQRLAPRHSRLHLCIETLRSSDLNRPLHCLNKLSTFRTGSCKTRCVRYQAAYSELHARKISLKSHIPLI